MWHEGGLLSAAKSDAVTMALARRLKCPRGNMQTPRVTTIRHLLLGAILTFTTVTVFPFPASAHEVRPAVLQIEETASSRYNITWRTPLLSGQPLPIVLR